MDNLLASSLLGWIGIFAPMAFGAIGSIVGCARAGQAAIGAMLEVESGYGKYIGLSAMPSSQVIYGIVIMLPSSVHNTAKCGRLVCRRRTRRDSSADMLCL